MDNQGFEFSNRQISMLLTLCVSLFLIYIIYVEITRIDMDNSKNASIYFMNLEYEGKVFYKDYDKSNHNNPTLYFKDKTQVTINSNFWIKINKGDSLVKKKGETIITVYRNNEKFILDNKVIIDSLKKKQWKK